MRWYDFSNYNILKENKRLDSEENKPLLALFKNDLFDTKDTRSMHNVIKKYFEFTDNINTLNNIAHTNETCNNVSKTVRKLLKKIMNTK